MSTNQLFDLTNKIACVTGASSGIGRHIAHFLASQGAYVVGIARRKQALQEWQKNCPDPNKTAYVAENIALDAHINTIAENVRGHFGAPDILINAAGYNPRQKADDISIETWHNTLAINLSASFFLARAFVNDMRSKKWGRIVNFASLQSFRAFPAGIAYGASKGGVAQLTRAMAEAWSADGITANAIAPGFFETELTAAVFADKERAKRNAQQTCIGRNGDMCDLEGPIQFLCSNASNYITGQILMLDGGFTAK